MRAYWSIALVIGGVAALVCLPLLLSGSFDAVTSRVEGIYAAWGWITVTPAPRAIWFEILLLVISGVGISFGLVESTQAIERLLLGGLSLGLLLLASPAFALHGILIDPVCPVLAGLLSIVGSLIFARTRLGQRKRFLDSALGNRISGDLYRELLQARHLPDLESSHRETATLVCRMFADSDSDSLPPADILKIGSHFRRTVITMLLNKRAVINESGPEKVSATFGMITEEENPAALACQAALELKARLRGLGQECETRWFQPLRWGIGIACGDSVVGLCGTQDAPCFSLIGGGAEFADRLALANARLGSDLLIETDTWRRVSDQFEMRPLETLYDPERQSLSEVYQVLAAKGQFSEVEKSSRDHFWKGVIHLRERKLEAALESFSRARPPAGDDPVLERFLTLAQEEASAPESRGSRLIRELTDEGHSRLLQKL